MGAWNIPRRHHRDLDPATVFDVGVSKGTPELYAAFPDAHFVLVEPLTENEPDMRRILETVKGECVLAAAGAEPGTATLNVEPDKRGMSSMLDRAPSTATGDEPERREVPVVTLDQLAATTGAGRPYGVKVDAEGFEVEVLRGARGMLEHTQFVIAEASTTRRFEGGYQCADLLDEMRARGFEVRDVMRSTRRFADLLLLPTGR